MVNKYENETNTDVDTVSGQSDLAKVLALPSGMTPTGTFEN